MKKLSLLLFTGATLALASCGGDTSGNNAPSQAQIDSMVNARVEELKAEMAAKNDSMINAMAQMKADSIIAATKSGSTTAKNVPAKTTKPATTKPTTPPKSDKQDKLDRMSGNNDTKKVTPQQTEEKKGKLDRMR